MSDKDPYAPIETHDFTELKHWAESEPIPYQISLQLMVLFFEAAPTKSTFNRRYTSYQLKHFAETISNALMTAGLTDRYEYTGNAHLVQMMIRAGFLAANTAKRGCYPQANYYFNVPEATYKVITDYHYGTAQPKTGLLEAMDKHLGQRGWVKHTVKQLLEAQKPDMATAEVL